MEIDGNAYRWLVLVVIDHEEVPEETMPSLREAKYPAAVVLRRDWEFLFDQLKSTHAVAQYFERVAGKELALGDEPLRYYGLAQADASATPAAVLPELLGVGELFSTPLLPIAPVASASCTGTSVESNIGWLPN